jgi:hypothetical protein
MTESIMKAASNCLLIAIKEQNDFYSVSIQDLSSTMLIILTENKQDDRIIVSMYKTILLLLKNNLFYSNLDVQATWGQILYQILLDESRRSSNILKLRLTIDLLVMLFELAFEDIPLTKQILLTLCKFLLHKYPVIRKCEL